MQFMLMLKTDPKVRTVPTPELMSAMGKLTEETANAGILVQTGGMQGSAASANLKLSRGIVSVTDGPYVESKEVVGGYAIVDVESRAKAIELAREFLEIHAKILGPSHEMESEVRQMFPVGASQRG